MFGRIESIHPFFFERPFFSVYYVENKSKAKKYKGIYRGFNMCVKEAKKQGSTSYAAN
jgi:hypothetical protein